MVLYEADISGLDVINVERTAVVAVLEYDGSPTPGRETDVVSLDWFNIEGLPKETDPYSRNAIRVLVDWS